MKQMSGTTCVIISLVLILLSDKNKEKYLLHPLTQTLGIYGTFYQREFFDADGPLRSKFPSTF